MYSCMCNIDVVSFSANVVQANFPAEVKGNIALIKRGSCEFGLKIALAGAAGAAGAIIYNNADGPVGGGTLGQPSRPEIGPYVPAGSISGVDGNALLAQMASGTVTGSIVVNAVNEDRYTSNVLATTKSGDKKNVVMAGGHTDSVPAGPVSSFQFFISRRINKMDRASTMTDLDLWVSSRLPYSYPRGQ